MESSNFVDDDRCDRITIITKISVKLYENRWMMPSASQESSYKQALSHVARICSNNTDNLPPGTVLSCRLKNCSRDKSRKHCLKEVLALLQSMERKRLYDPPGDDEIQHYILLKRLIRSLITFFDAQILDPDSRNCQILTRFPFYAALGDTQQLVELNWHFADLSAFVSDMDIRNGTSIKPLMSMKSNEEMEPFIYGSKERSNMFYSHCFNQALMDLRSTEFAFCYAPAEEMRCYVQVANALPENQGQPFIYEEKNIYSNQLEYLLRERIHLEGSDIGRYFREIEVAIFEKLSISNHLGSLDEKLAYYPWSRNRDEISTDFGKEIAEKYKVFDQDLPSYITHVDRCLFLASYMNRLISSWDLEHFIRMNEANCNPPLREHVGWMALHAVTLLKRGSVVNRSIFQNQPNLPKVNKKSTIAVPRKVLDESKRKREHLSPDEGKSGNVKILEDILEIIRHIGDADVKQPDEEEKQLMIKIWQNVASSVHLFFLAVAFEQRRFIMEHDVSPSACMQGMRTRKKRNSLTAPMFDYKLYNLRHHLRFLTIILASYKNALLERLQKLQQKHIVPV